MDAVSNKERVKNRINSLLGRSRVVVILHMIRNAVLWPIVGYFVFAFHQYEAGPWAYLSVAMLGSFMGFIKGKDLEEQYTIEALMLMTHWAQIDPTFEVESFMDKSWPKTR